MSVTIEDAPCDSVTATKLNGDESDLLFIPHNYASDPLDSKGDPSYTNVDTDVDTKVTEENLTKEFLPPSPLDDATKEDTTKENPSDTKNQAQESYDNPESIEDDDYEYYETLKEFLEFVYANRQSINPYEKYYPSYITYTNNITYNGIYPFNIGAPTSTYENAYRRLEAAAIAHVGNMRKIRQDERKDMEKRKKKKEQLEKQLEKQAQVEKYKKKYDEYLQSERDSLIDRIIRSFSKSAGIGVVHIVPDRDIEIVKLVFADKIKHIQKTSNGSIAVSFDV